MARLARQPATRLQLSGHRFLIRRLTHALVRGDARMLDDPIRAQSVSFGAGCVLAVLAIVACLVLVFVRPGSGLGSAPILLGRDSGALHVRVGGTVHPVLNLASARLIAGSPAEPVLVPETAIAAAKRGPLLGIPGAPTRIDRPLAIDETSWAVCDAGESTALIAARSFDGLAPLPRATALLVVPRGETAATTYLLFDGARAAVDLRDIAVLRALRMEGIQPLPVSRALLDSLPELPAVRAPLIADAGTPGPPMLDGLAVGTVVRVMRTSPGESAQIDGSYADYHLVLADGLQRIDRVVADLVRFTVAQPGDEPPVVAAAAAADAPLVESLAVATVPHKVQRHPGAVTCGAWDPTRPASGAKTTLLVGDSLPAGGLNLAQADEAGPNIDTVLIPAGRSAYVRATSIADNPQDQGPRYLVTDLGVLFGIHDDTAAQHLGLAAPAVPAPWPMLARLPRGPELSGDAASVMRDAVTVGRALR